MYIKEVTLLGCKFSLQRLAINHTLENKRFYDDNYCISNAADQINTSLFPHAAIILERPNSSNYYKYICPRTECTQNKQHRSSLGDLHLSVMQRRWFCLQKTLSSARL